MKATRSRILHFMLSGMLCTTTFSCSRCSQKPPEPPQPHVFSAPIDIDSISEVQLALPKWEARLKRASSGEWEIIPTAGQKIIDRLADSTFVQHLLDTLRTIQTEAAPEGTPSLSALGLDPPACILRWVDNGITSEIAIGIPVPGDGSARYALSNEQKPIHPLIVRGATLRMLAYITSFDTLRRRILLTVGTDDVDEVELHRTNQEIFYAQRLSDDWGDRKNGPLRLQVTPWLEKLTHLRVKKFIDDPTMAKTLLREIKQSQLPQLTFRGRRLNTQNGTGPVELAAAFIRGELYASVSSRPGAVFQLYPESLRLFTGP